MYHHAFDMHPGATYWAYGPYQQLPPNIAAPLPDYQYGFVGTHAAGPPMYPPVDVLPPHTVKAADSNTDDMTGATESKNSGESNSAFSEKSSQVSVAKRERVVIKVVDPSTGEDLTDSITVKYNEVQKQIAESTAAEQKEQGEKKSSPREEKKSRFPHQKQHFVRGGKETTDRTKPLHSEHRAQPQAWVTPEVRQQPNTLQPTDLCTTSTTPAAVVKPVSTTESESAKLPEVTCVLNDKKEIVEVLSDDKAVIEDIKLSDFKSSPQKPLKEVPPQNSSVTKESKKAEVVSPSCQTSKVASQSPQKQSTESGKTASSDKPTEAKPIQILPKTATWGEKFSKANVPAQHAPSVCLTLSDQSQESQVTPCVEETVSKQLTAPPGVAKPQTCPWGQKSSSSIKKPVVEVEPELDEDGFQVVKQKKQPKTLSFGSSDRQRPGGFSPGFSAGSKVPFNPDSSSTDSMSDRPRAVAFGRGRGSFAGRSRSQEREGGSSFGSNTFRGRGRGMYPGGNFRGGARPAYTRPAADCDNRGDEPAPQEEVTIMTSLQSGPTATESNWADAIDSTEAAAVSKESSGKSAGFSWSSVVRRGPATAPVPLSKSPPPSESRPAWAVAGPSHSDNRQSVSSSNRGNQSNYSSSRRFSPDRSRSGRIDHFDDRPTRGGDRRGYAGSAYNSRWSPGRDRDRDRPRCTSPKDRRGYSPRRYSPVRGRDDRDRDYSPRRYSPARRQRSPDQFSSLQNNSRFDDSSRSRRRSTSRSPSRSPEYSSRRDDYPRDVSPGRLLPANAGSARPRQPRVAVVNPMKKE